jgi:hypothetical protein
MESIEWQLQLSLNRIQDWADNNGVKFSFIFVKNINVIVIIQTSNLNGTPIKIVEVKFLGVFFFIVIYQKLLPKA